MTDHRTGRYELQELIAGQWITFSSDDILDFAVSAAKILPCPKGRRFRIWDSQENKVVWPEEQ